MRSDSIVTGTYNKLVFVSRMLSFFGFILVIIVIWLLWGNRI